MIQFLNRDAKVIDVLCGGAIAMAIVLTVFGLAVNPPAHASTQRIPYEWEREIGREKITPVASTALNVPTGATHAEFRVSGGDVFVRTDGGTVNDAATTSTADAATMWDAFLWSEGHHRKEENDGPMLSAMRFKCAACTVWVSYRARRGAGQ